VNKIALTQQKNEGASKQATVRIRSEILPFLDQLVMDAKDEFGIPLFSSRQEVVTEAVRELLRKYQNDSRRQ